MNLDKFKKHEDEVFKDVKGYEGCYMVSNYGNLISLHSGKPRELKSGKIHTGYISVKLQKDNKKFRTDIHRLVAQAFIDTDDFNKQVNHKDGNKENNHVSNLEWVSCKENINHSLKNKIKKTKISPEKVEELCKFLSTKECSNYTYDDISKKFNLDVKDLMPIVNRKRWTNISENYPNFYKIKIKTRKISDEEFTEICEYIKNNPNKTNLELSRKLNINRSYIRDIKKCKYRKNITTKYFKVL